jgi:hypothetical protein
MQRHHVDKPGLPCTERSSSIDSASGSDGPTLASIALFALVGLTLDTLGSAIVWFEPAAFQRYCRVVDGSGVATLIQLVVGFGPALWLLFDDIRRPGKDLGAPAWRSHGVRLMDALALIHFVGYVLLLRAPWLFEQASAHNRMDVWSARLSSTISGIAFVAFFQILGSGILFIATAMATLRALRSAGFLHNPRLSGRFAVAVWTLCAMDFAGAMVTVIVFATGSLC